MRAYAKAWGVYDAAEKKTDIPRGAIFDLVRDIDFELARTAIRGQSEADRR